MKIAGIDYSLTGPCVAVFEGEPEDFNYDDCEFYFLSNISKYTEDFLQNIHGAMFDAWNTDEERYDNISGWAIDILKKHDVEIVYVEGYSMGSKGRVFNLAENGGVLKHKIWKSGIEINIVAPTAVKKFATGKGNAKKENMHDSFVEETGINLALEVTPDKSKIDSPVSDIVDAYYILKYGIEDQP